MNNELKTTLKDLLEDSLPKTWDDFKNLHPDQGWVIHTINNLLTEKVFLPQFKQKLVDVYAAKDNNLTVDKTLETLFPANKIRLDLYPEIQSLLKEPLFLDPPASPKVPDRWLQLAQDLVINENLEAKFHRKYKTWNKAQIALKLRDLCKEASNEGELESIIEKLKNER